MLGFLCQSLFGSTQCKPVEAQLPGENQTGAAGNRKELRTGLQGNTSNSSVSTEIGRSNVAVLIMVAPAADLQQVGHSG